MSNIIPHDDHNAIFFPVDTSMQSIRYSDTNALLLRITMGSADHFVALRNQLLGELQSFNSNPTFQNQLQALVGKITSLRQFYDPLKEVITKKHIGDMTKDAEALLEQLPQERPPKAAELLLQLIHQYRQTAEKLDNDKDGTSAREFNCAVKGLISGKYCYIPEEEMNRIIPLGSDNRPLKTMQEGTSTVTRYGGLFVKQKPRQLWEGLASRFLKELTHMVLEAPTDFAVLERSLSRRPSKGPTKTYYAQFSWGVQGMSPKKIFFEYPDYVLKFDPIATGHLITSRIFLKCQDDNLGNMMCITQKDQDGDVIAVVPIVIDGDICLAHTLCRVPKSTDHIVNVRTFLWNLPQMYGKIHPEVRAHYAKLNNGAVLLEWLYQLWETNERFAKTYQNEIPKEKMQRMGIPIRLMEDTVPQMYSEMQAVTTFMRDQTEATYMDLLKTVLPEMGHYYDIINRMFPNKPAEAFQHLFFAGGPAYEEVMREQLDKDAPFAESLKRFDHSLDDYTLLRNTPPEVAAEQFMRTFNFQGLEDDEQRQVLDIAFRFSMREVTFKNCSVLRDADIEQLMRQNPPAKITIINCPRLTDVALDTLVSKKSDLEIVLKRCPQISQGKIEALQNSKYFRKVDTRDRRDTVLVPRNPLTESMQIVGPLKDFTSALDQPQVDWEEVALHFRACTATNQAPQAITRLKHKLRTTPLMRQILEKDQRLALEFLLKLVPLTQRNAQGQTFFHLAAELGKSEMLRWLCKQKVEWKEVRDALQRTPYHIAIDNEQWDCLKVLLEEKVPHTFKDKSEISPLRLAIQKKELSAIRDLLNASQEEDLKEKDQAGKSLVQTLCMVKLPELVSDFCKKCPSLATQADRSVGRHPLFYAIELNQPDAFLAFLNEKTASTPDDNGTTPLMLAAQLNRTLMLRSLLDAKANPLATDKHGASAIHYAASTGSLESLRILLGENPTKDILNKVRKDGKTALHLAATAGKLDCVKWLCEKGCDIMSRDNAPEGSETTEGAREFTPAHYAAASGHWSVVEHFLNLRYPVDFDQNTFKETCLMLALKGRHFEVARQLLARSASLQKENIRGLSPLHQAAKAGDCVVMNFLTQEIKPPLSVTTTSSSRKIYPLHAAVAGGHLEAVVWLLARGAPVDAADNQGKTPLHVAAHLGREEIVKRLIAAKANPHLATKNDEMTCLHYAVHYSYPELVRYFIQLAPELLHHRTFDDGHSVAHRAMKQQNLKLLEKSLSREKIAQMRRVQLEVIEILLQNGLDVNDLDNWGYVPLLSAVKELRIDCIELLLLRDANPRVRQIHGDNAIDYAKSLAKHEPEAKMKAYLQAMVDTMESHVPICQRSPEERKEILLSHLKKDGGFRRESLLLMRTLENQQDPVARKLFLRELNGIQRAWDKAPLPESNQKLEPDWKTAKVEERRKRMLDQLTAIMDKEKTKNFEREFLLDQLSLSLMKTHTTLFLNATFKELLETSQNLTINCTLFILLEADEKLIKQRLELILDWMKQSYKYGDLHQTYALFKAATHAAVAHLQHIRGHLSQPHSQFFQECELIFKNYPAVLEQRLSPTIPAFQILSLDLAPHRERAKRLILPTHRYYAESQLFLTKELFPGLWQYKAKKDILPGDHFAWEQAHKILPKKKK